MKPTILLGLFALGLLSCHKDPPILIANTSNSGVVLLLSFNRVDPKIYITVGGEKVPVIFDTGSSGLRILKGALGKATYTDLNVRLQSGYSGADHGLNMKGELVEANFGMDTLKSKQPVPFMLIDYVQYINKDTATAWFATDTVAVLPAGVSSYGGFSANMGVGMRIDNTKVGSPIPQMSGNGKYLVHFPPAGHITGGYVIINPSGADIAKFKNWEQLDSGKYHLPNGVKSYADDNLAGTLTIGGTAYSVGTLLDTGNPAVWTESPLFSGVQVQHSPTVVTMALATQPAATSTTFKVNQAQPGGDLVEINLNKNKTANSFGAQFFFDYDVLFDSINGKIWIAGK